MRECPVCQTPMEEKVAYVTECCGAELSEGVNVCPFCGAKNPIIVADEPIVFCETCGFAVSGGAHDSV